MYIIHHLIVCQDVIIDKDTILNGPQNNQIPEYINVMVKALVDRNYLIVAGILLTFVVMMLRKFVLP